MTQSLQNRNPHAFFSVHLHAPIILLLFLTHGIWECVGGFSVQIVKGWGFVDVVKRPVSISQESFVNLLGCVEIFMGIISDVSEGGC